MASIPLEVHGKIHSFRFERSFIQKWIIHDFDCEKVNNEELLPSTKFEFNFGKDVQFVGELYLEGGSCSKRYCNFTLYCKTMNEWKVQLNLFLDERTLDFKNLKEDYNKVRCSLYESSCLLSKYKFNNAVIITCKVVYVNYIDENAIAKLFETKNDLDVTLIVSGREFRAHKFVLASRSKVFAEILKHKVGDDETDKVNIADIDPGVFLEILRYVYTKKVNNLNQMASELLRASDIYDLPKLKSMCENELMKHVTIETAADILILADLHGAQKLLERTIKIIKYNYGDVEKTKGWQSLVDKGHKLLPEIQMDLVENLRIQQLEVQKLPKSSY